jgi:NAD(P)-dependent dehydrogenase (short-subunit alcohol dehydrogenase family)
MSRDRVPETFESPSGRVVLFDDHVAVRADVSNLPDLDTMYATIKREFGHLDGVFVNAGYSECLLFEDVTELSFDRVIAVNFKGKNPNFIRGRVPTATGYRVAQSDHVVAVQVQR